MNKFVLTFSIVTICWFSQALFAQNNLIFYDDFKGNQIDQGKWNTLFPWGNNPEELSTIFMPQNVEVNDGLKLILKEQPNCYDWWFFPGPKTGCPELYPACDVFETHSCTQNKFRPIDVENACNNLPIECYTHDACLCLIPRWHQYTSGMIFSKQQFKFGTFEMRCKIPNMGYAAFWLYGQNCEEIDIFEFLSCGNDTFTTTIHECPPSNDANNLHCGKTINGADFSQGFHTWKLIWSPDEITVQVDGSEVYHCNANGINACLYHTLNVAGGSCTFGTNTLFPNHPMNLIISLTEKNNKRCSSTPTPAVMEIEYVKVWSDVPPKCDAENYTYQGSSDPTNPLVLNSSINSNYKIHARDVITATIGYMTIENFTNAPEIEWKAGEYIEINNITFEVEDGAIFTAEYSPCDDSNLRIIPDENNNNTIILQSTSAGGKNTPVNEENKARNLQNNISPNPSPGIFTLMSKNPVQKIEIRDMVGKMLYSKSINDQINLDINLSNQPKGIYILQMQSGDQVFTEKIIIQ